MTLVELLVIGLLLFLLLGAAAMLTRAFVAPSYWPLVWGLGLLMMGAYLGAVIVGLRHLGRRASLWAEFGRRLLTFRRACADFALVLPEGVEWSAKRGLLDGGAALAPETHERLVHAVARFERVLEDYPALTGDGSAPGELIVRRRGDQWQLLWRVEGADDRLHSEGPLSEATPGSTRTTPRQFP
ncbi:Hypothetical protein AA314_05557 [Archangium gephyra]|uniref:Uncharacterized protein n=1 Tax=Archangium gephyra TaxID=48 RepID=A0AAC8TGU8_9BACT|nr:Hypothetical protein AA314_05557 [Archangium gephyra]